MKLATRREDLPSEIRDARVRLLRARLSKAWERAERLRDAEGPALAALEEASAARRAFRTTPGGSEGLSAERHVEQQLEYARLVDALTTATVAHRRARHETTVALCEIDELEAELEQLTGEPPEDGEGLRARRRLAANVSLVPPREQDPNRLSGTGMDHHRSQLLTTGSIAPRWAAHEITNDRCFVDARQNGQTDG